MANDPLFLLVTCGDDDLGILQANEARRAALDYAREVHRSVTLRDHVTDRVVATVRPSRKQVSNAAAHKFIRSSVNARPSRRITLSPRVKPTRSRPT